MTVKVGILGAAGRMGRMLVQAVKQDERCVLASALVHADEPLKGQDAGSVAGAGHMGVSLSSDIVAGITAAEVLIDFTTPAATLAHALVALEQRRPMVIGTTGFSSLQLAGLQGYSSDIPLLYSANMSLGIALLAEITRRLAERLDTTYDIEIIEAHHRHKVDAPSGTALWLGQAAATGRAISLAMPVDLTRQGARRHGDIGFSVIRGGDIVGDHTVLFAGDGERLELTHKASSRQVFARGAVFAALWLKDQPPGWYSLADALKLF